MLDIDIRHKHYPDRGGHIHTALSTLRLSVRTGEFVCVVGPSGCGKSTLLNLVGGLDTDFAGHIRVDGRAPGERTGFMFQEPRLMPWLSVIDNVCLVAGKDTSARKRAQALLEAMELGDVLDVYPGRLSGGMQRRVALARAFVIEPALLLMDEPFVSLDRPTANRLRTMLIDLWQRCGTTVLFVTHDVHEALALADRVVFLSAAPATMLLEHRIELPRPRHPEDEAISHLHARLMQDHPTLLTGLVPPTGQPADEDALHA